MINYIVKLFTALHPRKDRHGPVIAAMHFVLGISDETRFMFFYDDGLLCFSLAHSFTPMARDVVRCGADQHDVPFFKCRFQIGHYHFFGCRTFGRVKVSARNCHDFWFRKWQTFETNAALGCGSNQQRSVGRDCQYGCVMMNLFQHPSRLNHSQCVRRNGS